MKDFAKSIACSLALFAGPVAAQTPSNENQDEPDEVVITVEGFRKAEREIARFSRELTRVSANSPLSRYNPGEYCPRVTGLSDNLNAAIASRMVQVAAAADVRPSNASDCSTSALVMFSDDLKVLEKQFRKQHPEYFRELSGEDIEFSGDASQVRAWTLRSRVDRSETPVGVDPETGIQIVVNTGSVTRLQAASRPVTVMSVLLIRPKAVRGFSVQQIADYAFMRTQTDFEPKRLAENAGPTILSLLDTPLGAEAPLSLSTWDLAYVKGRYATSPWNLGPTQAAKIRGTMKRALLGMEDYEPQAPARP